MTFLVEQSFCKDSYTAYHSPYNVKEGEGSVTYQLGVSHNHKRSWATKELWWVCR